MTEEPSGERNRSDRPRTDEYKAARRAVARRLHPDVGGDPEEYTAALAAVDRAFTRAVPAANSTAFTRSRRTTVLRNLRKVQKRLRRRRYHDL